MNSKEPNQASFDKKKSIAIAYVLLAFLGIIAAHRLYLGQRKPAMMIILSIILPLNIPMILVILDTQAPPLGNELAPLAIPAMMMLWLIPLALLLVDVFQLPDLVRNHNEKILQKVRS